MDATQVFPRIWIGCLAAYNAGTLHGEWVDATDADVLEDARARVIATSPVEGAEEHFIADSEGFGDMVDEYSDLEEVAELGAAIDEYGPVFLAYCEAVGVEEDAGVVENFEEARTGAASLEELAEQYLAEGLYGEVPEAIAPYIDMRAIARDLGADGYFEAGGEVFRLV